MCHGRGQGRPGARRLDELLAWTRHLRADDGGYWTGCVHPDCVRFPAGQKSTYSAAAVILADHVLNRRSLAAATFSDGTFSDATFSDADLLSCPVRGWRWSRGRQLERADAGQQLSGRSPARADARRDAHPAVAGAGQGDHRGMAGQGRLGRGDPVQVAHCVLGHRRRANGSPAMPKVQPRRRAVPVR